MAILQTISVTMLDAEFLLINGVAAPTITKASPLYEIGATATSSAGTTTITLPVGKRDSNTIRRLTRILDRAAVSYNVPRTF